MPTARVHRLSAAGPSDVTPLEQAFAERRIDPAGIVAVLGKTEGNGCVNDFTRAYAVDALRGLLARHLPDAHAQAVCLVMSGGTEGGLAPHWLVLEVGDDHRGERPALAIGRSRTPPLPPERLGRRQQVEMVAAAVSEAVADAGIAMVDDVHLVQVKVPLLTAARIARSEGDGRSVATRDTLKSMALSRGAAALGVAVALGEVDLDAVTDACIGADLSLWSGRASTSAGSELQDHEIVVLGMSDRWSGPLVVDHAVMRDQIDVEPVRDMLARLGLGGPGQLTSDQRSRIAALLVKADPGTGGRLRQHRHVMLDDSDIPATRHARAFVGGALAGLIGHAELFVSGGAEHQGPDGGGPVAVIAARR